MLVNNFNIFEIFGCENDEKIHSNILAWLLNPKESHGLNDAFLRSFFKKVFNKESPLSTVICVKRAPGQEDGRLDIKVECKDWLLIIENKIDAEESPGQTKEYASIYEKTGGIDERYFLAYLTKNGKPPESESFHSVSYRDIAELLQELIRTGDSSILIRSFIEHIYHDF